MKQSSRVEREHDEYFVRSSVKINPSASCRDDNWVNTGEKWASAINWTGGKLWYMGSFALGTCRSILDGKSTRRCSFLITDIQWGVGEWKRTIEGVSCRKWLLKVVHWPRARFWYWTKINVVMVYRWIGVFHLKIFTEIVWSNFRGFTSIISTSVSYLDAHNQIYYWGSDWNAPLRHASRSPSAFNVNKKMSISQKSAFNRERSYSREGNQDLNTNQLSLVDSKEASPFGTLILVPVEMA